MSTVAHQAPAGGVNNRPLWAAAAVLGVTVMALGASLVHIQTRPVDGHAALADFDPAELDLLPDSAHPRPATPVGQGASGQAKRVAPAPAAKPAGMATVATPAATAPRTSSPPVQHEPDPATARPDAMPPAVLVAPAPFVVGTQESAPLVMGESGPLVSRALPMPARAMCASCGRVESVHAMERQSQSQGVAVLAYQVQVRMEDGSLRMLEQSIAPAIGSAVFVEGQRMRAAHGVPPPNPDGAPAPVTPQAAKVYSTERN